MHCRLCNSNIHTEDTCLTIWRSYIVKKNTKTQYPSNIFCYNCGHHGHYGDDCYEPRRVQLRFVEDSAFTGKILPKQYQHQYFEKVAKDKRNYESNKHYSNEISASRKDKRVTYREREKDYRKNRGNYNNNDSGNNSSWRDNRDNRDNRNSRDNRDRRGNRNNSGSWKNDRNDRDRSHRSYEGRSNGNYQEYQRYSGYGNKRRSGYSMDY